MRLEKEKYGDPESMKLLVFSNNTYLHIACKAIFPHATLSQHLAILDPSSYPSLRAIRNAIVESEITQDYQILILEGNDLCSRLFSELSTLSLQESINNIKQLTAVIYQPESVLRYIAQRLSLTKLSREELHLTYAIRSEKTIKRAASKLNINEKKLYHHAGTAASRLHLRSGKEFIYFLHKEFIYSTS